MDPKEIERLALVGTPPARLGRYVILGRLGYGGMAQIYLARAMGEAGFEKLVVIKRLHDHLVEQPMLVQMFLDEARLAARLTHPNVVQTFDVGIEGSSYFLVMEYVEGQNLSHVVKYAKKYDRYPAPEFWAALMTHILDGLHYAHVLHDLHARPLNIVHRDISPQNILVSYDGTPKLVDFGIAKAAQRTVQTAAGTLKGKYTYMSPEQCLAEELDHRSDIFAAGIVLYELCTGTRLFKDRSDLRTVQRILSGEIRPPHEVNPMLHPRLGGTILRALARHREDRWQSCAEFRDALESDLSAVRYRLRKKDIAEYMSDIFQEVLEYQRHKVEEVLREQHPPGELPVINPAQSTPSPSMQLPDVLYTDESLDAGSRQRSDEPESEMTRSLRQGSAPSLSGLAASTYDPDNLDADTEESDVAPEPLVGADEAAVPEEADTSRSGALPVPVQEAAPARGRRGWAVPLAAFVSLLIAAAVLVAVMMAGPDDETDLDEPRTDRLSLAGTDQGETPGDDVAPDPGDDEKRDADRTDDGDTAGGAGDEDVKPTAGADESIVGAAATDTAAPASDSDPIGKGIIGKGIKGKKGKRGTKGDASRKDTAAPATAAPVTGAPAPTTSAPVAAAEGTLTLKTIPWTEVYWGKKKLGDTPLVRVTLPAGRVELLLVNDAEGIRYPYSVKIKPGEETFKKLGLK